MIQLAPVLALACILFLDFEREDLRIKLVNGAMRFGGALEFTRTFGIRRGL